MNEPTPAPAPGAKRYGGIRLKPGQHLFQLDRATGVITRVEVVREDGQRPRAILVPDRQTVVALNMDNARRKLAQDRPE